MSIERNHAIRDRNERKQHTNKNVEVNRELSPNVMCATKRK